jgi:hypothetical protein
MNYSLYCTAGVNEADHVRSLISVTPGTLAPAVATRHEPLALHVPLRDHYADQRELTNDTELRQPEGRLGMRSASAAVDPSHLPGSEWSKTELDDSILSLCDEFPEARMTSCSRALEHCRRCTPRSTPEALRAAMREILKLEMTTQRSAFPIAA